MVIHCNNAATFNKLVPDKTKYLPSSHSATLPDISPNKQPLAKTNKRKVNKK